MPGRGLTFAALVLLAALPALAAGCDGGGAGGEPTASASPAATMEEATVTVTLATATSPPAGTATPAPDITEQDLTNQPGLRNFLASAGGEVNPNEITYIDLTDDGVEEAVVPVSSGGEGGDIALFVFGYGAGGLQELLRVLPENGSLRASITDGALTVTEPVFGPGDPLCCPRQLRTTTYRWDGSRLVVAHQETAPAAGN